MLTLSAALLGSVGIGLGLGGTNVDAQSPAMAFSEPSNTKEKAFKEEMDDELDELRATLRKDILTSFPKVDLRSYQYYPTDLAYDDEEEDWDSVVREVSQAQEIGDFDILVYLNEQKDAGYILEKKADGTNQIYKIARDDKTWSVTNMEKKKGTPVKKITEKHKKLFPDGYEKSIPKLEKKMKKIEEAQKDSQDD